MQTFNVSAAQLSQLVNQMLFLDSNANLRVDVSADALRGVAAAANNVILAASGAVSPIGPPKKRAALASRRVAGPGFGVAATGSPSPIGPPKRIDAFVADLVKRNTIAVPRNYPDLSAWVQWRVPANLRQASLAVAAAQFQAAAAWVDADLSGTVEQAASDLIGAALG
jgi:hypothetical protein